MAVLLIGSTGSGKSTLGNFLFDPKSDNEEQFDVAKDNLPKTQTCEAITHDVRYRQGRNDTSEDSLGAQSSTFDQSKAAKLTGFMKDTINKVSKLAIDDIGITTSLTVIDTPGVNESGEKDLKHMTDLVTTLKKEQVFKGCIFVVKFAQKIDQQYRDTIKYYATLLPDLFSQNCLIVLTEYATDKRSEAIRKKKGLDYDTVVKNVKKEILKSSGICFTPIIFAIDSVPYEEDEVERSKRVRDAIISYIFSLREVRMTEFLVAKTRILKDEDREVISSYNGEIQGYKERQQQMNASAKEALDDLQKKEKCITDIRANLKRQRKNLSEMDTDDLVTGHVWSVDDQWKFFKWQEKAFDETSKFEVHGAGRRWTNGHCQWKEYIQEANRVHGIVQGNFMRGLYASITLETKKRIKHAKDIEDLKEAIKSSESELHNAEVAEEECREKHSKFASEISDLKKFIEEKRKMIDCLSVDTMTLEQAKARLEKQ